MAKRQSDVKRYLFLGASPRKIKNVMTTDPGAAAGHLFEEEK